MNFREIISKHALLIIVLFLLFFNKVEAQDNLISSLKRQTMFAERDELDSIYFELFYAYSSTNTDSAFKYAELARDMAYSNRDSVVWMRSEYALGYLLLYENRFNDAIPRFTVSRDIADKNPDLEHSRSRFVASLNMLGRSYYLTGKLDSALKYHLLSLDARESDGGDPYDLSVAQNNLGLVFYQMKQYDRALTYFENGLENRLLSEDSLDMEGFMVNIGLCYSGLADEQNPESPLLSTYLNQAEDYFHRALNSCEDSTRICKPGMIYEAYTGLGIIYTTMEKYDSSLYMHKRAMELSKENDNDYNSVKSLINLAITYRESENLDEALINARQALSLLRADDDETNLIQLYEIHRELSTIYKNLGNIDSAFYHLEQYDIYSDQVFSTTISSTLEKWATNIISAQDETIATTQAEREAQEQQKQLIILVSIIIILLTSVFVVILYRSNKLRKKANEKLVRANLTIEEKNNELQNVNLILEDRVKERTKELKISNEALRQSNLELDNFIYKTSHDIRGPLATLQGICNVALIDIKDDKAIDYLVKLNNTATKLNEILSKLLIINQINNSDITKHQISFEEIIQQTILENIEKSPEKHIEAKVNIDKGIVFRSDEDLLRIIIGNLVSNAFKFYKKSFSVKSFVEIAVKKNNLGIEIGVVDNGIGVQDGEQSKIFEIFSKATEMSDSAGLGLYLVKLSVEKLNGKINLKTTKEGFTQFLVALPYSK